MKSRGFTVVELVITITIMGILMTIGVAGFVNTQASSRDAERKADVEAIALHLENFYKYGSTSSSGAIIEGGQYPYADAIDPADTPNCSTTAYVRSVLRDMDKKSTLSPGHNADTVCNFISQENSIVPIDTLSVDEYDYQPLTEDGIFCTAGSTCRSYNLYYATETDTSANNPNCDKETKICKIESQNQ